MQVIKQIIKIDLLLVIIAKRSFCKLVIFVSAVLNHFLNVIQLSP